MSKELQNDTILPFQVGDIVKRRINYRSDIAHVTNLKIGIVSSVSTILGYGSNFIHILNLQTNKIEFAHINYIEKINEE